MKKILALSTSYPLRPDSVSGIFVHNLYKAMADSWSIEVLCPDDNRPSGGIMDGVTVLPVRYMPKKLQTLGGAGGILPSLKANPLKLLLLPLLLASFLMQTLIRARTADVIHTNWAICGVIAAVAGRLLNKKIVLTLRGSDVEKAQNSRIFRWQLQAALSGANFVVCVSEAMKNTVIGMFPGAAGKLGYCHNGISDQFFSTNQSTFLQQAPLRILAVGALIPVKGFDLLLAALKALPPEVNFEVSIIGEGPERERLQQQIMQYNLNSKVSLKGEVAYQDMPGIMSTFDLFVLSSRAEGRPNVVAEAVASALPVISADLPGVQGLVEPGKNGWLYKVGDVNALSSRIVQAAELRSQLRAMGECGRIRIQAHSRWSASASYYSGLFNRLIDGDAA